MPMKPIRERNPTVVGVIGVLIIALIVVATTQAGKLPLIGGGTTYYASFTEVGGLAKGDDVRMAGVLIGKVDSLDLDGDRVRVGFTVTKDADQLRSQTAASIRIKTLLGTMYLALSPAGSGPLPKGATIPSSRTTPPYDIVSAFSGLSTTTEKINTGQLAYAMKVLAQVTQKTPAAFRGTVSGITRLSTDLARRDQQLNTLFKNLSGVSGVLDAHDQQIARLFKDGGTLFAAITARRQAVHQLLIQVQSLSNQLRRLVAGTQGDLKPALDQLSGVVRVLQANQKNLNTALLELPTFYSGVTSAAGNGPWIDGFLYNLLSMLGVDGL